MRILLSVVLGVGLAGCATSAKLERESRLHQQRADAAANIGEYGRARDEQYEANRLHAKAVKRAYKEGNTSDVIVNP